MTTIGPKTANGATFISDLATELLNNGGWTDADTSVTNDQASDAWDSNGRALYHANSDTYLAFFLDNNIDDLHWNDKNTIGVVFTTSTDWNGENHHPAGLTNVGPDSPFSGTVGSSINDSFEEVNTNNLNKNEPYTERLTPFADGYNPQPSTFATSADSTDKFTYNISVGTDYITIGAYNSDPNHGAAAVWSWENLTSKFWADGRPAIHTHGATNFGGNNPECWQTTEFHTTDWRGQVIDSGTPYQYHGTVKSTDYGFINPDPDDDSFFFQYPVLQDANTPRRPIAQPSATIPNSLNSGANDGDTVTENGNTYRFFVAAGGSKSNQLSYGLRWE